MTTVDSTARSGLVTFAGVMLLLAGAINMLAGIVAFADDGHYAADDLLFGGLTFWGVWWLALGALLVFAGLRVLARAASGAIIGFTLAGINAFTQFVSIGADPVWSSIAITIDIVIVWVLTTHVDEFE